MNFEVDRSDFHHTRRLETQPPELVDGQVLLEVESFALTANNISYAVAGDALDYWGFFPAESPWGRIPVMGIGRITESAHPSLNVGERFFGFFPMSDHHVVAAKPNRGGFIDMGEHRGPHAAVYRSFSRLDADHAYEQTSEGRYLIARGLFITSFLVDDFLGESDFFGAGSVLVTSASSRTSLALAHCLRTRGGQRVIGLTSPRSREFVESTGLYDDIVLYDDATTLDAQEPSVIVDMAGDTNLLATLHTHFGDNLKYSCRIGGTHWEATKSTEPLPGPKPTFFFAPNQIKKRSDEWGSDLFEARVASALSAFIDNSCEWMTIERSAGIESLAAVYEAVLSGSTSAGVGHICTLSGVRERRANDVPIAHTPSGGWSDMPEAFLDGCTEPLVDEAPDLRGTWKVVAVAVNGTDDPTHAAIGRTQRIEQAGDRLIVTASKIVHDMRCDGTEQHGVHDVAERDLATPITVVATYEDGVHILRPVGLPIEVKRRRDGEQMVWDYVGFTARLDKVSEQT